MTRLAQLSGLAALLVLGASCDDEPPPRAQWLVFVGTDAPIPGFGDRLVVDVHAPSGELCASCSRTFDVGDPAALPVSFGVVPEGDGRPWVRARLFRAEATDAAGAPVSPLLDVLGRLPEVGEGPTHVAITLAMDCFGAPVDVEAKTACNPDSGAIEELEFAPGDASSLPQPGSFAGGDQPCDTDPPDGMVCIPGGVFLLGHASFVPFGAAFDPVPQQLVRVAPFHLDIEEMSIATYRSLLGQGVPEPDGASTAEPHCRFTAAPMDHEAESVNCVTHAGAQAACEALGKRLPSEAEWEYAAGARSIQAPFPWAISGSDNEALCRQAALGRSELLDENGSRLCMNLVEGLEVGPARHPSDVSLLGLRDLGGNLSEWTLDDFRPFADETCWGSDLSLRDDPVCAAGGAESPARGGSWDNIPYNSHSFFRRPIPKTAAVAFMGVRCAQSAKDPR